MAELERRGESDLREVLKPFFERASEAEDRLARLEAALASKRDAENEEHLKVINELQSKLEIKDRELLAEREKAERLAAENGKIQYRMIHLLRAAREAHDMLELV